MTTTTTTAEEKAERLKERKEVRQALQQTATAKAEVKPVVETRGKVWLLTYALLLLTLGGIYYLLRLGAFNFAGNYMCRSRKGSRSARWPSRSPCWWRRP